MGEVSSYDGPERRKVGRVRLNLPCRWEGRLAGAAATVTDLSTAGAFVLSEDLVQAGELVRLELLLPGGGITLWGHVIYKAEGIGFGLRFAPYQQEDDRRMLGLLVRAEARRAARKNKKTSPF
jgi:hypothetical protein